jgi:Fe2+ transport system protein FeoA
MATALQPLMPLAALQAGEAGIVEEVMGLPAIVLRLEELGLRAGKAVEVVQAGSPCIVRIDGHKLCFRDGEACEVLVRVGPES